MDTAQDFFHHHHFVSTHWSAIRASAETDQSGVAAREELCRDYWYPLYAYLQRTGCSSHDAADLVQNFFVHILQRSWLRRTDQAKGKFRSFLLSSLKNFRRDQLARQKAKKRGGTYMHVPLHSPMGEALPVREQVASVDPAEIYELEWAEAVSEASLARLEREYCDAGKEDVHRHLKVFLSVPGDKTLYAGAAAKLGMSLENIAVSVHRLRKDYGAILRSEVTRTVSAPEDVEGELLHLRDVLSRA